MSSAPLRRPNASLAAAWIIGFLSIGPIIFPIDWLFHIFPDSFPVIERMHGLGPLPKALWVLCAPLGVATIVLLLRRPVRGLLACVLFAAVYVPTAVVLWGQFSLGAWGAIAATLLAGFGAVHARQAN